MNTCLFVTWRSEENGVTHWGPVGRLDYHDGSFRFIYTRGAETLPGFYPFVGMTDLHTEYVSETLFPLFSNRMLSPRRPEYENYLIWSGFNPMTPPDPLALLGVTEGRRVTDMVEVFLRPVPDAGRYRMKFFLHGIRHMPNEAQKALEALQAGDRLGFMLDVTNDHDPHAVVVRTCQPEKRFMIGYIPRYLAKDITALCRQVVPGEIFLKVERVNIQAPLQQKLLCSVDAPWPATFDPCGGEEYQPIVAEMAVPV